MKGFKKNNILIFKLNSQVGVSESEIKYKSSKLFTSLVLFTIIAEKG